MKKILLATSLLLASLSAGELSISLYKDYKYNQDVSDLNLSKSESDSFFKNTDMNSSFSQKDKVFIIYKDNKIKFVHLAINNFDLKHEIEEKLKLGFRLKSIRYKNKFSSNIEIKNVGDLLSKIEEDTSRSEVFDVASESILVFENILEQVKLVMRVDIAIDRDNPKCIMCTEVNGDKFSETRLLHLFFTKL